MKIDLEGFKRNCFDRYPVDGLIIVDGRAMTDSETRILVNYGIEKGYETADQVPDEIVKEICDTHGGAEWMRDYDDTPTYITLPYLERILKKLSGFYYNDWDGDDIYRQIVEEL